MNWYLEVLQRKYAEFNGRAHREEFWMFVAVNLGIMIVLAIVADLVHLRILSTIYALAVLIPSLAVGARRLHDTNRTGWWQLIGVVPVIGLLVLIYFFIQDSDASANQYGQNPKTTAAAV